MPVCLQAYALLGRLASWRSLKICLMFQSGDCKLHSRRNREHGYAGPVSECIWTTRVLTSTAELCNWAEIRNIITSHSKTGHLA